MASEQFGSYRNGTSAPNAVQERPAAPERPRLQTEQSAHPPVNPAITRYRVSDDLWSKLKPIIDAYDPPVRTSGRKRIDPRGALDAIIYQTLTGCGWNRLPAAFPDDSSVHRTYQRWKRVGVLNLLWTTIVEEDMTRQTRAG